MHRPALMMTAAALLLAGCADNSTPSAEAPVGDEVATSMITGIAVYRERIALPPGAVFEASLEDVARAGARAIVLGRTTITDPTPPPIRFSIPYDPADLSDRGQYTVRATIHVDGQLRFSTDTFNPVLQHEGDTEIEVHLRAVGGAGSDPEPEESGRADEHAEPATSQAELTNTYWRINRMHGQAVDLVEGHREPHIILREVDGERSFSATVGCNRLNGGLEIDAAELRFAPGASTLMACPPPLDEMEAELVELLTATRGWGIEGEDLSLFDETGAEIAHLSSVYF